METELAQLPPFADLDQSLRAAIARDSRVLRIPPGRWLLRRGRRLQGHYYLLGGAVRAFEPERIVTETDPPVERAVYPGSTALYTLLPSRFLRISDAAMELVAADAAPGHVLLDQADDGWQARFLRGHFFEALSPVVFQHLLRELVPRPVLVDEVIVREGEAPRFGCCYVLAAGRALVQAEGYRDARLEAGALFGEDALIAQQRRNATVRMLEDGCLMVCAAPVFKGFLEAALQSGAFPAEPRAATASFRVVTSAGLRERIAALDPGGIYGVDSEAPGLEALARFLLLRAGLRIGVRTDQALTVRPSAQVRREAMLSPRMIDMG